MLAVVFDSACKFKVVGRRNSQIVKNQSSVLKDRVFYVLIYVNVLFFRFKISFLSPLISLRIFSQIYMTKRNNKAKVIWKKVCFLFIIPLIVTLIGILVVTVINECKRCGLTSSLKDSIFSEILDARNRLGLALLYFNKVEPVLTNLSFDLNYKEKVPEIFANNQDLKTKLEQVYLAISAAKKSSEELSIFVTEKRLTKTIAQRKNDIARAIDLTDKVGPILAEEVNRAWKIPPKGLSDDQKIEWLNNVIVYSDASAPTVEFRWNFPED